MEPDIKSADRFARLWQQAEEVLLGRAPEGGALAPQDVQRALHDLQVYQVELELQNEELHRAQAELEAAHETFTRLYEFAPIGYFTLDETGRIREANLKGATMLGVERAKLVGQRLSRFIAAKDQDAFHLYSVRLRQASETQVCELCMVRKDGSQFHARLEADKQMQAEQPAADLLISPSSRGIVPRARAAPRARRGRGDRREAEAGQSSNSSIDQSPNLPIYQVVMSDISRRAALEEDLRDANEELELRVAERTAELKQANRQVHALADSLAGERSTLKTIMEHTNIMLAYLDRDSNFIRVNPAMVRNTGLTKEELIGRNYFEVYPHAEHRALFERVRETGEALTFQAMPLVDPKIVSGIPQQVAESNDGVSNLLGQVEASAPPAHRGQESNNGVPDLLGRGTVYWDWTLAPVKDERGQVAGMVLSVQDVTERREAEIERERLLRQLEAERVLLQAVIEHAPEGIVVADASGRIVLSNPAADRLYARPAPYGQDYASHAELGLCYPDGTPYAPRDLPLTRAALDGETHIGVDMTILWPDGLRRRLWVSAAPIRDGQGRLSGAVGVFEDITERKRAEQALRESEERFRLLADDAPVLIWLNGLEGCEFVNRAYLDFVGVSSQADLQGYNWAPFVHPEDREGYLNVYLECFARQAPFEAQYRLRRQDGVYRWMKTVGQPRITAAGECLGYVGICADITDIKEAEAARRRQADELEELVARRTAALQASEARFRAIFEGAAIGISITDLDGRLITSNPALQAMLGYSDPELSGKAFSEFTHPEDVVGNLMLFQELAAGQREGYNLEKRYLRKDGEVIWARVAVSLVRGADGQPGFAIAMVEDITRHKQAQAALVQSEKLAVVGRLTASLTHEINNPLQSVVGCLGLAEEALAEGRDAGRYLEVAKEELRRTARIVGQLRDLHRRPQAGQRKPTDVNALIEQVLALNRPRCRALGVEVEWTPGEGLPSIAAAPGQLQQVFLNLVLNALDAMPDGGRLRISAEATQQPGGVRVSLEDSGMGIPEHALPRIFDPFFTTREDGLGLGLFICHNIMVEHGGRIQVESQVGQGTTFTVWLPTKWGEAAPE